jgi:uridine kinase
MVQRKAIFRRQAYLIAVAGGTASGKTTVCHNIIEHLGDTNKRVVIISQDSFYRNLTAEDLTLAKAGDYNFDHPNAFDDGLFKQVLCDLKDGLPVKIPCYDFKTHSRIVGKEEIIDNADVVLVEGILVFYDPEIRKLFDMRIFVDTDSDIRLARRVQRDLTERGRNIVQVLHQYTTFVKPAFDEFCFPTKKYADLIIPRGAENVIAIELLVQRISEILRSPRSSSTNSLDSDGKQSDEENHIPSMCGDYTPH